MNILYLSPNGYLGGAEKFVVDINTQHKLHSNLKSHILFFHSGEACQIAEERKLSYSLLPFSVRMRNPFSIWKAAKYIQKFIKENNITILHSTMPYSFIIGAIAVRGTKAKHVWFQHGPVGGILDKIAMFFKADKILFNSKYLQQAHNQIFMAKTQKEKQAIIPLGIEIPLLANNESEKIRNQFLAQSKKILLVSAGRICEWKGQDRILKALKILKEQQPTIFNLCHLLIIGQAKRENDKVYFQKLIDYAKEENLETSVSFLGHCWPLAPYLKASDIFIHSSTISEPFGLVVGEAMLTKTFVIGSNQGGVSDLLIDRKTGFAFPSCHKDSPTYLSQILHHVIDMILHQDAEINEIKEKAFHHVQEHFSPIKMHESCLKSYQEILT